MAGRRSLGPTYQGKLGSPFHAEPVQLRDGGHPLHCAKSLAFSACEPIQNQKCLICLQTTQGALINDDPNRIDRLGGVHAFEPQAGMMGFFLIRRKARRACRCTDFGSSPKHSRKRSAIRDFPEHLDRGLACAGSRFADRFVGKIAQCTLGFREAPISFPFGAEFLEQPTCQGVLVDLGMLRSLIKCFSQTLSHSTISTAMPFPEYHTTHRYAK